MRTITKPFGYLFLIIIFFSACKKEPTIPELPGSKNFVSATLVGAYTKDVLQAIAIKAGFGNFAPLAKYDVEFYKLIYKTRFKGKEIQVSGLLAIPQNAPAMPSLLSAQHGTMFKYSDAPSNFPNTFTGFELFGSAGFVTMLPDFIGYGISQNVTHPYFDQEYSGLTVIDMINATKYFLQKKSFAISSRLFMVGYSEGGYVTMAAQKEIETNASHQLTLTAAAEGAGAYDLTVMLNGIATKTTFAEPSLLTFILKAYDSTYDWKRPFSDFFKEPYASKIPSLLDGSSDRTTIDAALTTSTAGLFNPLFYAGLLDPTKETVLKQQLIKNSFINWLPKSSTRLYHGTADQAVFFETSSVTFARFQAAGATNVEFFPILGGTHETSIQPMMLNALPWILSLDK